MQSMLFFFYGVKTSPFYIPEESIVHLETNPAKSYTYFIRNELTTPFEVGRCIGFTSPIWIKWGKQNGWWRNVKHIPKYVRVVEKMDIFLCTNLMMQMFMEAHGYGVVNLFCIFYSRKEWILHGCTHGFFLKFFWSYDKNK